MKHTKLLIAVFLITCLVFTLVACGEKDDGYKVIIHPTNGENDVEWDAKGSIPNFTKEGYVLEGFYIDGSFDTSISLE
ncbi:MAG: hypothetical protein J6Q06_02010, partial [Clostridia bacterium]|nr:hypothetical protein [Clostridia bacterium]